MPAETLPSNETLEIGTTWYIPTRAEHLGKVPCMHIKNENGEYVATEEEQQAIKWRPSGYLDGRCVEAGRVSAKSTFYGAGGVLRIAGRHEKLADILLIEFASQPDKFGFFGSSTDPYAPANCTDQDGPNSLKPGQLWMKESVFSDLIATGKIKQDRRKSDDPKNMSLERAREIMDGLLQPKTLKFRDSDDSCKGELDAHYTKISASVAGVIAGAHQAIIKDIEKKQ